VAILQVAEFGGVLPSVAHRDLPPTAAQTATNLDQRFDDFRPTKAVGASVTTVASGAKSIYRTPISGTWLSSANDVDYVPNQNQDLTQERVYLTGRSAYPEAWENGSYRHLGVPRPASAPTFTVEEVYQFTTQEAVEYRNATIKTYTEALEDNLTAAYAGYSGTAPVALPDGAFWLPHGSAAGLPTNDARMGAFCVPVTASGSSFSVVSPKHLFVVNPALNGKVVTYNGGSYLAIPLYASGSVYTFDSAGFQADVALILHPETGLQLFPGANISAVASGYADRFSLATTPQKEMIADLNQFVDRAARYLAPPSDAMLVQAVADFYATLMSSGGAIDKAADNLANTLYELAEAVWLTAVDSPFLTTAIPSDVMAFVEPE
jgi:hypothetical protein